MTLLNKDGTFPPIQATTGNITADERSSAIDFINRVNLIFEEDDHEKMANAFLPDSNVYHYLGVISGHDEMRTMFRDEYTYKIPGVSRNATNHIVDRDEETGGVVVRYNQHLFRYAWPKDAGAMSAGTGLREPFASSDGMPRIWMYCKVMDRLKQTETGWKIYERYVGDSVVNKALDPNNQPA